MSRLFGVILAGGESRRFDYQCKALQLLAGRPLIQHCIDFLHSQPLSEIAIASNKAPELSHLPYPQLEDLSCERQGPLAALLAGLEWAENIASDSLVLTTPCDTPILPADLTLSLTAALENERDCVIAHSSNRSHPTIGLWRAALASRLRQHLIKAEKLSMQAWLDHCDFRAVRFAPVTGLDPFTNVNTRGDLQKLEAQLAPK